MKTEGGYSLPWHRTNNDIVDHPKTGHLEELVGDPNALAYITRLFSWTMRHCPRGRLAPFHAQSVENACRWRGESGRLITAFVTAGWLDPTSDGGWRVHDWDEFQGAAVAKAEKDIKRKRQSRALKASKERSRDRGVGARSARVDEDEDEDEDSLSLPSLSESTGTPAVATTGVAEDKHSHSPQNTPLDVAPAPPPLADIDGWLKWADARRMAYGADPTSVAGPQVRLWALDFVAKYGDGDQLERLKPAFDDFLDWTAKTGRSPGWGLWMREAVWLDRWSQVRAGALPRQSGLGLGPLNVAGGSPGAKTRVG